MYTIAEAHNLLQYTGYTSAAISIICWFLGGVPMTRILEGHAQTVMQNV